MKAEKFYSDLTSELNNIYSESSDSEDNTYSRSLDECLILASIYTEVYKIIFKLEDTEEDLLKLFEKKYEKPAYIINPKKALERCLNSDYLFSESKFYSFDKDKKIEEAPLKELIDEMNSWCQTAMNSHKESQDQLFNNFNADLKQSELKCSCQKCIADYKTKLRDSVFDQAKELIKEFTLSIEDKIVNEDLNILAKSYERLKNSIDKKNAKIKNKLRRGSVNKLVSDIKYNLKQNIGVQSDIGKAHGLRVKSFLISLLVEMGHDSDILSEEEYQKFYSQQGLNLWRNKNFIQREFEKFIRAILAFKRKDISATILREYLGQFWVHSKARSKNRKIIYHMGPTNSGKTYHAIEALAESETGCYLAPLRLLASELYDTLNEKNVPTSLLTGEEVIETEGAKHYSSTIEMARLNEEFDCVVIDEIQMITDSQRGWAWTRALVNMNSPVIQICGDQSVLELVEKILKLTGDTLEIKNYERKTKLAVEKSQVRLVDLARNDTLIVFSRKNALKYKRDLENLGYKVSVVYGRLSPEVRREQARKFDSGETDIMVATDAIAMGMNLPVRRIVFSAVAKFYNSQEYPLTASELKQIAGRAGRYQRFPEGYVTTLKKVDNGLDIIQKALHAKLDQKELAMVGPDLDIFRSVNKALEENNLKTLGLSEFLRLFNTMTFEKPFYCVDLTEMIEVTEMVEGLDKEKALSDAEIFGFACAPVNLGLTEHVEYFIAIANKYVANQLITNEEIDVDSDLIDYLETSIKCVELYQWLARHFDGINFEFNEKELLHNKSLAIEKLNEILSEKIANHCPSCGVKLAETFEFNICETCFAQRKQNRYRKKVSKKGSDKKGSGKKYSKPRSGTKKFSKKKKY